MIVSAPKIKIFADGAEINGILALSKDPLIKGFTTNPTLMHRSGVTDYELFAREVLEHVTDLPVSFEVIADDFTEMAKQARRIASWGNNVYVKIPITNTLGATSVPLVAELSGEGLRINVTAVMTLNQVESIVRVLNPEIPCIVSVFAGRIADTGRDPTPVIAESIRVLKEFPLTEVLWASPREVLNIVQAENVGCHIITVTHDLLAKLSGLNRDLDDVSLDTVKMFFDDATRSGLVL